MSGEALTTQRLTTAYFLRQFFGGGLKWGNAKAMQGLKKLLTIYPCNFDRFGLGNYPNLLPLNDLGNQ